MAAGYKGERTVVLAPTDFPILKALADVCTDVMKKVGLSVDYQALDWGSVVQRRAKKEPLDGDPGTSLHRGWADREAVGFWGKAGQRLLDRSALVVEAAAQLTRALEQIATLPGTPALRREQIMLQSPSLPRSSTSKAMPLSNPRLLRSRHGC
jgi:peptide/nickel transport system substrate-binding protein